VPGPFTFETRREVLERVLTLQAGTDLTLISEDEFARIRRIWAEDAAQAAAWEAEAHPSS